MYMPRLPPMRVLLEARPFIVPGGPWRRNQSTRPCSSCAQPDTPRLFYSEVRAPDASPTKTMLFLHGILGQGANWGSIARQFTTAKPHWRAFLVDLRAHGRSAHVTDGSDTVAQCARNVAALLPSPDAVLGHSFGGKVALQYAHFEHLGGHCDIFSVDSPPGASRAGSAWVLKVLDVLRADTENGTTFASRKDFIAHVSELLGGTREGTSVAQWLSMNVRTDSGGNRFRFQLDVARIRALMEDYFQTDLWDTLGKKSQARTHLIIAEKSALYRSEDRARAFATAEERKERVTATFIAKAGHNVHVDAPEELLDLLIAHTT